MLSDTERDALEDIRDNIARAMRFVDGFDLDAFLVDDKTFYAATPYILQFACEIFRFASEILASRARRSSLRRCPKQAIRFRRARPGLDPGVDPCIQG
jgi:hypothetical protein